MMDAGKVFREHHTALYRYLVRLTGDEDAAADAAAEAFRRMLERPPTSARPRTWLFKVATNVVRETSRTRTRRLRLLDVSPDRAPVGEAPLRPDAAAEAREREREVQWALDTLSLKERTLLLMYREGFSHREIAEAIGTTTKSVGTMTARALRKFASALRVDPESLR